MNDNLLSKFLEAASIYADKEAIRYKDDNSWKGLNWGEVSAKVQAVSGFLKEKNVKKGDNVAVVLTNSPYWPVTFFGIVSLGAVVIPVNPQASAGEIINIFNDSKPVLAFVDKHFLSFQRQGKFNDLKLSEIVDVHSEKFSAMFSATGAKVPERGLFEDVMPDDTACILYTSGTTGDPKGVVLSHGNLRGNCLSLNKRGVIKNTDTVLSMLPLHHAYPLTITMLLPLSFGASIVYPSGMSGEEIFEAIVNGNISVLVSVPQFFHGLHKKITDKLNRIPLPVSVILSFIIQFLYFVRRLTGVNISRFVLRSVHKKFGKSMRLFATGGAKLDEKVTRDLLKLGFTLSEGYGLSETSPVLTFNPPEKPKIGSAGTPIPDVEVKIVDPGENGIGEVVARGPNIMKGYYKREDLTGEVIKDGWFHTGDLGYFDSEGYLFLTGRVKDIIVLSSGLNILPGELEEAYMKGAHVKEMCVFDTPPPKGVKADSVLWAVVRPDLEVFKKHGEVNLKEVIKERLDNVSRTLPAQNRIMGFSVTMEELPRTTLGKLKRFEIKEKFAPGKTSEGFRLAGKSPAIEQDRDLMDSDIAKKITTQLKKKFDIKDDISAGDSLEMDLGIDSLGRVELVSAMEEMFGSGVQDEAIAEVFTVRDLISSMKSFEEGNNGGSSGEHISSQSDDYWRSILAEPPRKENLEKIDLKPGLGAWVVGFLFLLPIFIFFKIFYRLRVEGKENVAGIKRHILYVNHTSYYDGLVLGVSLPRWPRLDMFFIGFRVFFEVPIIRRLTRVGRIIPIDLGSHLTEALRSCYYVLENEKNLCIFPEGKRTLDGALTDFKKGFGILAKESDALLVPVSIEGVYEAWPRTSKYPGIHPIKVKFGKPVKVEELEKRYSGKDKETDKYSIICEEAKKLLEELKENKR